MEQETETTTIPTLTSPRPEFVLQWGSRKRLRCVKVSEESSPVKSDKLRRTKPRINRCIFKEKDTPVLPSPCRPAPLPHRKSELTCSENPSPEKERFYSTRGSALGCEDNSNLAIRREGGRNFVLPRFFISLSNKEKEEDFMAMKGCKLPQRPKKRSKLLQKCLLTISPGAWLSDLCQERYEVREKKSTRKRVRGLKALCMESDSE